MIIPWNTDAPVYHWPAATVGLIVLNVLAFIVTSAAVFNETRTYGAPDADALAPDDDVDLQKLGEDLKKIRDLRQKQQGQNAPAPQPPVDPEDEEDPEMAEPVGRGIGRALIDPDDLDPKLSAEEAEKALPTVYRNFALVYGRGLKPWQWFTSLFVHGDIFHLLGNMLFLWSFGLVVEGKVGWWRFLLIFLGIGMAESFFEQALSFWFRSGVSYGASAAIFGLMSICLVWAPMNEMNVIWWIGYRVFHLEVLIWKLALLHIVTNGVIVILTGAQVTSELMHTMGGIIGFGLGVLLVKLNWVDCENWDMFSVMAGKHIKDTLHARHIPDRRKMTWNDDDKKDKGSPDQLQKLAGKLHRLLKAGDLDAAVVEHEKFRDLGGELDEPDLLKLAELYLADKQVSEAVPLLEEYLDRFEAQQAVVRLKLARIYLSEQRPRAAVKVLKPLKSDQLTPSLAERRKTFVEKARQMIDQGTMEFSE